MDEYLKEALEIVKAQAGVREMTADQITDMVSSLAAGIRIIAPGAAASDAPEFGNPLDAIKEKSIINLEDGTVYKVLTKRNLAKFGLTPDEYRAKWGYPKGTPLICKALQRERRRKMKEMKLWEKRVKA